LFAALHVKDWRDPDEVLTAQRRFTEIWIRSDAFRARFPDNIGPEVFVNGIFDNARLPSDTEARQRQIGALRAGKDRAEVLREVIQIDSFKQRENARALVLLQFPLQLHRDIDFNDERYRPWLEKIERGEQFDSWRAICMFLTSEEYQQRFGSEITHQNAECSR